jgi:polyhydroxyalkanoate synthesis regulator phasin
MDEHDKSSNGSGEPGESGNATDAPEVNDAASASDADAKADEAQDSGDTVKAVRSLIEQVLEDALVRVKGGSGKIGSRASQTVGSVLGELGLAQRRDQEDLELRIAQLEHRIRLLEAQDDESGGPMTTGSEEQSSSTS